MDTTRCPDHRWQVTSRHPTSEGVVAYQRCSCGAHRVLQAAPLVGGPEVLVVAGARPAGDGPARRAAGLVGP